MGGVFEAGLICRRGRSGDAILTEVAQCDPSGEELDSLCQFSYGLSGAVWADRFVESRQVIAVGNADTPGRGPVGERIGERGIGPIEGRRQECERAQFGGQRHVGHGAAFTRTMKSMHETSAPPLSKRLRSSHRKISRDNSHYRTANRFVRFVTLTTTLCASGFSESYNATNLSRTLNDRQRIGNRVPLKEICEEFE